MKKKSTNVQPQENADLTFLPDPKEKDLLKRVDWSGIIPRESRCKYCGDVVFWGKLRGGSRNNICIEVDKIIFERKLGTTFKAWYTLNERVHRCEQYLKSRDIVN